MTTQDRKWELKLYPDATNYNCSDVILKAQTFFDYWAFVLHDRDKNEDGTPIKPHYHLYGKTERKLTLEGIAYQLKLPTNAVQYVKTWKGAIRYLTHTDYPDKAQYDLDEVQSNFSLDAYFRAENEDQAMAKKIFEYLYENPDKTRRELLEWVFANELWSAFRRGYAVFDTIIRERNDNNEGSRYPSR